jgi:protein-L-isoaspartate(D-aspartate) O-methyltransferase
MAATPRAGFLPDALRDRAAYDGPLPISHGQTNSQPRTVRDMLVLLDVLPGSRVLDVGCGSCWTTAILARLTGPGGFVLGVERVPEVLEFGAANLGKAGVPWASVRRADPARLGAPDDGPFDRILVSAEARELPASLVGQLAPGGVMVMPVQGRMLRVAAPAERVPSGSADASITEHGSYRFVPLVEGG